VFNGVFLDKWLNSIYSMDILFFINPLLLLILLCAAFIICFQRKTITNLTKTNKAKSIFISKIGYELKTPINGILGYSEMLDGSYFGQLNITQRDRVRDINRCGQRIKEVMEDFLDLIYKHTGKIEVIRSKFKLSELVEDISYALQGKASANEVNIVKHLKEPNLLVYADRQKLFLALKNIFDNAIKFSSKGGQITLTGDIEEDNNLIIKIADNGAGIEKSEIKHIFNYPGEGGKGNSVSGMGLGLPLTKLLLDLHGADIRIDSEVGVCTVVTVTLPVR
jgi:two-component system, cell cycle sensor histidine kinase PleC